jgi:hypothetical protein
MKTQRRSPVSRTVMLTTFGSTLAMIAGQLAAGEASLPTGVNPKVVQPAASTALERAALLTPVVIDKTKLCKMKDEACLMARPYVVGLSVQTDIKDVCLVC